MLKLNIPLYSLNININKNDMKSFKAKRTDWRERVMKSLKLEYTIVNDMIVVKGSIGEYKTLVDMLVSERIKLGISTC